LCKQFLQYPYLWWDNSDQFAVWLTNIVIILPWLQSLGTDFADLFGRSLLQLPWWVCGARAEDHLQLCYSWSEIWKGSVLTLDVFVS
jgi:hypothetical protein